MRASAVGWLLLNCPKPCHTPCELGARLFGRDAHDGRFAVEFLRFFTNQVLLMPAESMARNFLGMQTCVCALLCLQLCEREAPDIGAGVQAQVSRHMKRPGNT